MPLLKGFDQVAIQAFMVLLGEGKQAHDHQSRQNKSVYEVLHHGYHSTGLAHYVVGDRAAKDDEHRGRSRQRAARPIEPGRPETARRDMTPIEYAKSEGLKRVSGQILHGNTVMLKMCRELGFEVKTDAEDPGLCDVTLLLAKL